MDEEMISPLQIDLQPNCLIARFPGMFTCLSWAPWNGGEASASVVANLQVGPKFMIDKLQTKDGFTT